MASSLIWMLLFRCTPLNPHSVRSHTARHSMSRRILVDYHPHSDHKNQLYARHLPLAIYGLSRLRGVI